MPSVFKSRSRLSEWKRQEKGPSDCDYDSLRHEIVSNYPIYIFSTFYLYNTQNLNSTYV